MSIHRSTFYILYIGLEMVWRAVNRKSTIFAPGLNFALKPYRFHQNTLVAVCSFPSEKEQALYLPTKSLAANVVVQKKILHPNI